MTPSYLWRGGVTCGDQRRVLAVGCTSVRFGEDGVLVEHGVHAVNAGARGEGMGAGDVLGEALGLDAGGQLQTLGKGQKVLGTVLADAAGLARSQAAGAVLAGHLGEVVGRAMDGRT